MTLTHMLEHYDTYISLEAEEEHTVVYCCSEMAQLVELSDGFVDGNGWLELWGIELFLSTRKDIMNHRCKGD